MRFDPSLNVDSIQDIRDKLLASGETFNTAAFVRYLNQTGFPQLSLKELEATAGEVIEIYNRYIDYRSRSDEHIFLPKSMKEFEAFKNAEKEYGGEAFVLSSRDIIRIIEEGGKEDDILHSCIRKDSKYLVAYISSIEANGLNLSATIPIYGFYKCRNEHNQTFSKLVEKRSNLGAGYTSL